MRSGPAPEELAPRVVPWFGAVRRDLPWRRTRSPYRTLVSEVMLQQTQVSRVVEYYRRFLRAFPSCRALARAPLEEVLRHWRGLGYYARARNLQRACQMIATRHGGRFPETFSEAAALPGVGPYTAGAVLSIAFGQRHAAVDANVRRVICRLLGERGDSARSRRRVAEFAARAVPEARPGDYNQAVMELGALVCASRSPRCQDCPLQDLCRAYLTGRQHAVPTSARRKAEPVAVALAVAARRGRVLVAQRHTEGRWGGLWEFPHCELRNGEDPRAALVHLLAEGFGLEAAVGGLLTTLTHTIMQQRVTVAAYRAVVRAGRLRPRRHVSARWVLPAEVDGYPMPSPHRRVARLTAEG